MSQKKSLQPIKIYGHRGARALFPENTLPGYAEALRLNCDFLDVDVGVTADGILIAAHDLWLNPDITQKNGTFIKKRPHDECLIHDLTLKELKEYDVGKINPDSFYAKLFPHQVSVPNTPMPTLQEIVHFTQKETKQHFQIEMKTDPRTPDWTVSPKIFAETLHAFLTQNDLTQRVEIQAFDWRCLFEINKIDPKIKTAYLVYTKKTFLDSDPQIAGLWSGGKLLKDYNNSFPQMVKALGGSLYEPLDTLLTKEEVDECHQLGLKVVSWSHPTINKTVYKKLVSFGVDGIILDDPKSV
jgi:glycerophosphoryl diester phosphodiesterase